MKTPTDEQLNLAMCEWMGWKRHAISKADPFVCERCGMHYARSIWREWEVAYLWCPKDGQESPPNYLSEDSPRRLLNEAEAQLTAIERINYVDNLNRCDGFYNAANDRQQLFRFASATERQRVVAILQTVKPEMFQ